MKVCSKCKGFKEASCFHKSLQVPSGLQSQCIECKRRPPVAKKRIEIVNGQKICKKCRVTQDVANFSVNTRAYSGLQTYCKGCARKVGKERWSRIRTTDYDFKWRDQRARNKLVKLYGITLEKRDEMMLNQGGACAICNQEFSKTPNVDHDHTTGKVRALLCQKCNAAIGLMNDSANIVQSAADYLRRFS